MDIYAWVGEDELRSGQFGIKQGIVPAGYIPLVSTHVEKLLRPDLLAQLELQAKVWGKEMRLARFVEADARLVILPSER